MADRVKVNPNGSTSSIAGAMEKWWDAKEGKVYEAAFSTIEQLQASSSDRFKRNITNLRLYGNADIDGFFPQQYTNVLAPNLPDARIKYNIISSTVDTVISKIGKMKPRISYLTTGGRWDEQQRARNLTKWTDGVFTKNDVYGIHQLMFRDASIMDSGVIKHYIKDGKIVSERILSTEIIVDRMDSMYGKPACIYHLKYMRRDDLIASYPEFKSQILVSQGKYTQDITANDQMDAHIAVVEAWHLESGPGREMGVTLFASKVRIS